MGDYNDHMLERLADAGNGNYAFVDTLAAARRIFVENLTGTLQVIAKDAKVQVDFNPAVVASYRLLGYENRAVADADFRNEPLSLPMPIIDRQFRKLDIVRDDQRRDIRQNVHLEKLHVIHAIGLDLWVRSQPAMNQFWNCPHH